MDYAIAHDREEWATKLPAFLILTVDNALHDVHDNGATREFKHLLLQFPEGHVLSSKTIYKDAGDDEELHFIILSLDGYHEVNNKQTKDSEGNPITFPTERIGFIVVHLDGKTSKRGEVEEQPSLSKAAQQLFGKWGYVDNNTVDDDDESF